MYCISSRYKNITTFQKCNIILYLIVNSWHWIDRCGGKNIHYFCWHPFEKCHKLVCCKKRGGHYDAPYTAFCATKRDCVRVRKLADSRYTWPCSSCIVLPYISFLWSPKFGISSIVSDKYLFMNEANAYSAYF